MCVCGGRCPASQWTLDRPSVSLSLPSSPPLSLPSSPSSSPQPSSLSRDHSLALSLSDTHVRVDFISNTVSCLTVDFCALITPPPPPPISSHDTTLPAPSTTLAPPLSSSEGREINMGLSGDDLQTLRHLA